MILIIGSAGSGKTEYARSLGYTDAQIGDRLEDEKPVLDHLERLIFADPDCAERIFPALLQKEAVICSEVGSGVIPAARSDRIGRETVGRLCIRLAREADCVVRMVCGLPQVIRGKLPG